MKVLITGAKGQLGSDLVHILMEKNFEVFGFSRDDLNVTNADSVRNVIQHLKPDVIIHSAAYTKVDQAETESELAYMVNSLGTRNVAMAAEQVGAKLCYVSTDYVFNGTKNSPYQENDIPDPLGVYGKSKHTGEEFTRTISTQYFIVRTSWVYGLHGHNFVKTMLKLAQSIDEIEVVNDQFGSPTYTVDLSFFLSELIQSRSFGVYHASNSGSCSWYEFAKSIFEEAGIFVKVRPVATEKFPRPAPRPRYSVLDHSAIRDNGFNDFRHWKEALKDYIVRLKTSQ